MPWYAIPFVLIASVAAVYGVLRFRARRSADVDPMVVYIVGIFAAMIVVSVASWIIEGPGTH